MFHSTISETFHFEIEWTINEVLKDWLRTITVGDQSKISNRDSLLDL